MPETTEQVETTTTPQPVTEIAKPEAETVDIEAMKAALKKANNEAAKYRKAAEEAENAKKAKEEAEMTELQKLTKRLAEAETKARDLELSQLRREIGAKTGLPQALADRLTGTTAEEMEADAKIIADALPKQAKPGSNTNPTNPGTGAGREITDDQLRAFMRGGPSPFR